MKKTFNEFYKDFPEATRLFESWLFNEYKVTKEMYDESISIYRHMIISRFLGHPILRDQDITDTQAEEQIIKMLSDYQKALANPIQDPLELLNEMPFNQRSNETFKRKTLPSLFDALIDLANHIHISLFDALIDYHGVTPLNTIKSVISPLTSLHDDSYIVSEAEEKFWLDNIQWTHDVKAEKILIPF
jgi:hypothetical protein